MAAATHRSSFIAWLPLAAVPLAVLVFALPGPTLSVPDQWDLLLSTPIHTALVFFGAALASLYGARVLHATASNDESPPLLALLPVIVPTVFCLLVSQSLLRSSVPSFGCGPAPRELVDTGNVAELSSFRVLALAFPAAGALCVAVAQLLQRGSGWRPRLLLTVAVLSLSASLFAAAWAFMAAQKGIGEIVSISFDSDEKLSVLVDRYAGLTRAANVLFASSVLLALASLRGASQSGLRAFTIVFAITVVGVVPRALAALEQRATNAWVDDVWKMRATTSTPIENPGIEITSTRSGLEALRKTLEDRSLWPWTPLSTRASERLSLEQLRPALQLATAHGSTRLLLFRELTPMALPRALAAGERLRSSYLEVAPVLLLRDTTKCRDAARLHLDQPAQRRLVLADDVWSFPCVRLPDDLKTTSAVATAAANAVTQGHLIALQID